jgi:hypothetical protein
MSRASMENPKEIEYTEGVGVDGRIILKLSLVGVCGLN